MRSKRLNGPPEQSSKRSKLFAEHEKGSRPPRTLDPPESPQILLLDRAARPSLPSRLSLPPRLSLRNHPLFDLHRPIMCPRNEDEAEDGQEGEEGVAHLHRVRVMFRLRLRRLRRPRRPAWRAKTILGS